MKRKFIYLILLILAGCKTPEVIKSYNIVNLNNTHSYINYKNPVVYYLPRNLIKIEFEIEKTEFMAGPFAEYADKYLGIGDAKQLDYINYQIADIRLSTAAIPDTNEIYLIENENFDTYINNIHLAPSGIIQSVNIPEYLRAEISMVEGSNFYMEDETDIIPFKDLTIKPFVEEKTTRSFNQVKTDSAVIRIPVTKTTIAKKSLEDKAGEAAAFIIKTRKRRFKLQAGMYENHPDGAALKAMVKEMDDLEAEYLSLFIGKEYKTIQRYVYYFDPLPEENINSEILFRMSDEYGIIRKGESSRKDILSNEPLGFPILINVIPYTNSKKLADFELSQVNKFKEKKGFHYRVPARVKVNIMSDLDIIYSQELLISQYGQVLSLPLSIFKNDSIGIEYHPEYGSIKSIRTIK